MFERFTPEAREVVVLAQDEARELEHNYIGTEHLLLGLLREEEGLAAEVLDSLGIKLEAARAAVVRVVGRGDEAISGAIPFTERAVKTCKGALQEAFALRPPPELGPEHILLGLVRLPDSTGARILDELGAPSDTVRASVLSALGH